MSPFHAYGSSIVLMTDPTSELHKLELSLRSMRADADGNPVQTGEPLMNNLGITRMLGHAQSLINQVTIMSNLDEDDISALVKNAGDAIIIDLMVNKRPYGILEPVNATRRVIWTMLVNSSYICMRRAFNGDDKRFWKGSTQEITTNVGGQQQRPSFWQRLAGMKG